MVKIPRDLWPFRKVCISDKAHILTHRCSAQVYSDGSVVPQIVLLINIRNHMILYFFISSLWMSQISQQTCLFHCIPPFPNSSLYLSLVALSTGKLQKRNHSWCGISQECTFALHPFRKTTTPWRWRSEVIGFDVPVAKERRERDDFFADQTNSLG